MLEVEMKFPVRDIAGVESCLIKAGASLANERRDADHYFNAPDRDFARTDERSACAHRPSQFGDL